MRQKFAWTIVMFCVAAPAHAIDGSLEQAAPSDLVKACIDGMAAGSDVSAFAEALRARESLNLIGEEASNANRCLRTHFNEHFYYIGGAFVSHEERRAEQRPIEQAQRAVEAQAAEERRRASETLLALEALIAAEEAENRAEFRERYKDACYDELQRHAFSALNAPQCVEIFLSNGFER